MSKAKELAREYRKLDYAELYDADLRSLLFPLIDAVLSEPEPLKGWIEVYDGVSLHFVNLERIIEVLPRGRGTNDKSLLIMYEDGKTWVKIACEESYEELKQKIARAS